MKMLLVLLPLLGLVAAQMNRQGGANRNENFFNDLGQQTSTLPPWAEPRGNAGRAVGGKLASPFGGSQSSTKPPHGVAPIGNPQLPVMAGANADPNAQGGNSGGRVGFGAIDYFNGELSPNVGAPQGAAPVGGGAGNTNPNSGEQNGGGFYGVGGGGMDMGPGLIAGGGFNHKEMQDKSNTKEVYSAAASASTIVGVVVAVLIVIGIFALVAVFLVRQRRNSRVVIGSV